MLMDFLTQVFGLIAGYFILYEKGQIFWASMMILAWWFPICIYNAQKQEEKRKREMAWAVQ